VIFCEQTIQRGYPSTDRCTASALLSRALRWVGEEAGENRQKKTGPRKQTWDLYCTSTGALQEPLKVTVCPGPVGEVKDDPNSLHCDTEQKVFPQASWLSSSAGHLTVLRMSVEERGSPCHCTTTLILSLCFLGCLFGVSVVCMSFQGILGNL